MDFVTFVFKTLDGVFDNQQNGREKYIGLKGQQYKSELNIPYSNEDACKLDIYYKPRTDKKYPVMFYIHGGGFVAGDKHHRRLLSRWYCEQGYFVVNINHGLCPEYTFPEPIVHIVKALNWVEKNADKYNLDLDRMMVGGDSAGGYFAAMLAVVCTNKELQNRIGVSTNLSFKGALLNCGIYDVGQALNAKVVLNMGEKILVDLAKIKKKDFDSYEWKDICAPINYVNSAFPKTHITYAEKDFFCGGQGPKMIAKLQGNGVYFEEYHTLKFTENHCFSLGWKGRAPEENLAGIKDFLIRFEKGEI